MTRTLVTVTYEQPGGVPATLVGYEFDSYYMDYPMPAGYIEIDDRTVTSIIGDYYSIIPINRVWSIVKRRDASNG